MKLHKKHDVKAEIYPKLYSINRILKSNTKIARQKNLKKLIRTCFSL